MTVFVDKIFKDIIKLKIKSLGWALIQHSVPLYKEIKTQTCRERKSYRDTGRQKSATPGKRPQKKPALQTSCSQTSGLKNCEKVTFYCGSHPVYATLSWHPLRIQYPKLNFSSHSELTKLQQKSFSNPPPFIISSITIFY